MNIDSIPDGGACLATRPVRLWWQCGESHRKWVRPNRQQNGRLLAFWALVARFQAEFAWNSGYVMCSLTPLVGSTCPLMETVTLTLFILSALTTAAELLLRLCPSCRRRNLVATQQATYTGLAILVFRGHSYRQHAGDRQRFARGHSFAGPSCSHTTLCLSLTSLPVSHSDVSWLNTLFSHLLLETQRVTRRSRSERK